MKHTPGPWRVEVVTEKDEFRAVTAGEFAIVSKDNLCPATVWEATLGEGGIANANLIAAAPDMLASLIDLFNIVSENGCAGRPTMDKARAAIAKAKGETP